MPVVRQVASVGAAVLVLTPLSPARADGFDSYIAGWSGSTKTREFYDRGAREWTQWYIQDCTYDWGYWETTKWELREKLFLSPDRSAGERRITCGQGGGGLWVDWGSQRNGKYFIEYMWGQGRIWANKVGARY